MTLILRFSKRALNRPSLQARSQSVRLNSNPLCPITTTKRFVAEGIFFVSGSFATLRRVRLPFAIFATVIAVILDSAKRHIRRTGTHVGKEICKTVFPSLANLDSASAVIFESGISRIKATLFHAMPRRIFGRMLSAGRRAVNAFPPLFIVKASATLRCAVRQRLSQNPFYVTAFTTAQPINAAAPDAFENRCYLQAAERLPV